MSLRTVPVTFAQAQQFVAAWHRNHRPPRGHKFSIGVADTDDVLVGVAIVGRPVARHLDDGLTLRATPDIRTCGIPPVGRPQWRARLRGRRPARLVGRHALMPI